MNRSSKYTYIEPPHELYCDKCDSFYLDPFYVSCECFGKTFIRPIKEERVKELEKIAQEIIDIQKEKKNNI